MTFQMNELLFKDTKRLSRRNVRSRYSKIRCIALSVEHGAAKSVFSTQHKCRHNVGLSVIFLRF